MAFDLDLDLATAQLADHRGAAAAVQLAVLVADVHVQPDVGLFQGIEYSRLMELALGHALDGLLDRPGDALVFDVGADIHCPVVILVVAGFAVAGGLVHHLAGVDLQGTASLDLGPFGGQAVAGVDGQVAAGADVAGLRGALAAAVLAAVVRHFYAVAGPVQAAGVIEAAAGGGAVAVLLGCVVRGQQLHMLAAQAGIAGRGRKVAALHLEIFAGSDRQGAAGEAGGLLPGAVAAVVALLILVAHPGPVLAGARCIFLGVGVEAALLGAAAVVLGVFGGRDLDRALGAGVQCPCCGDLGAADGQVLGALQLEVAVRAQLAADRGAALVLLAALVLGNAEELAVLAVVVAVGRVPHAVDGQRALVTDDAGLGAAAGLAAADTYAVGAHDQLAVGVDLAALVLGLALVAVGVLAEEATAHQVAGVALVALALLAAGAGDVDVLGAQQDVALAVQLGALQLQCLLAGQFQLLAALELAGDGALLAAGVVPVFLPQVLAMLALVTLGVGLGGSGQAQVAAALGAQAIAGLDAAALDLGAGAGIQLGILPGDDLVTVLAAVAVGVGTVVGFPGDADGAVFPLLAFFLELAAFDAAQGQVAPGVELDVAATDIGGGQGQVLGPMQLDVALAADPGTDRVEAVVHGLATDVQVTGGTQLDPVAAVHLDGADTHPGTFGGADDIDPPGLHGTEQAGVDALLLGAACRVDVTHLAAGVVQLVATDGDIQLVPGLEGTLAVDARGDQIDRTLCVAQATALDSQLAVGILGVEPLQLAVLEFRAAHHQAGIGGVDEAAAIDRDAIGVGQHEVGGAAEDLLGTIELRGIAADHLVEDHAGRLAVELLVGRQLPGQLRLPGLQGVVQYHALLPDVVVQELVVGQAAGIGRDDVDDGYATLVLQLGDAAGPLGHGDPAGQGQGQMGDQQQAGDGPAQCALGRKVEPVSVVRHENLVLSGVSRALLSKGATARDAQVRRLIQANRRSGQICRLNLASQTSGSVRKPSGVLRLRW